MAKKKLGGSEEGKTTRGISALSALFRAALVGANPQQRFILTVIGGFFIVLLVVAPILAATAALYGFLAIVAAFVLGLAGINQVVKLGSRSPQRISSGQPELSFLTVPNVEIPPRVIARLLSLVREVRGDCLKALSDIEPHENNQVRANVFLPDYRAPMKGCLFELYMHEGLTDQMTSPDEWGLRFNPGEGISGKVFNSGVSRITTEREFLASHRHKKIIDKNLKWVVSIPIKARNRETLAVLNVDGIGTQLDQDVLEALKSVMEARSADLTEVIEQIPRVRLSVAFVEEEMPDSE